MSLDREMPSLDKRGLAKTRIETLADGIFAVAMTLLVLDIKSPVNREFETGHSRPRSISSPTLSRWNTVSRCM